MSEVLESTAADMLRGVAAIAVYVGVEERQALHQLKQGYLPGFKIGALWHMRKSTYRAFLDRLEGKALKSALSGRSRNSAEILIA